MISKLTGSIISNEMFLVLVDVMVIAVVSIVLSIAASKKDEDFFSELADNGYVLNKKMLA